MFGDGQGLRWLVIVFGKSEEQRQIFWKYEVCNWMLSRLGILCGVSVALRMAWIDTMAGMVSAVGSRIQTLEGLALGCFLRSLLLSYSGAGETTSFAVAQGQLELGGIRGVGQVIWGDWFRGKDVMTSLVTATSHIIETCSCCRLQAVKFLKMAFKVWEVQWGKSEQRVTAVG